MDLVGRAGGEEGSVDVFAVVFPPLKESMSMRKDGTVGESDNVSLDSIAAIGDAGDRFRGAVMIVVDLGTPFSDAERDM